MLQVSLTGETALSGSLGRSEGNGTSQLLVPTARCSVAFPWDMSIIRQLTKSCSNSNCYSCWSEILQVGYHFKWIICPVHYWTQFSSKKWQKGKGSMLQTQMFGLFEKQSLLKVVAPGRLFGYGTAVGHD